MFLLYSVQHKRSYSTAYFCEIIESLNVISNLSLRAIIHLQSKKEV